MGLFDLHGKVAIVTGGNKGLGKTIALTLAEAGADVAIVGRSRELNEQTVAEIRQLGRNAIGYSIDLYHIPAIHTLVQEVKDQFGRLDILVNNAGTSNTKRATEITEADWDHVMDLNVKSLFFCCQAAAKVMIDQGYGKIINIASIAGAVGDVGISPYTASKGAVINLTRSLALEWVRHGIHVNAIGPAYIKTDLNAGQLENPKVLDKIVGKTPMRRLGQADELSGTVLLLASDASSYITGQTFFVDGGWLAQ